MSLVIPVSLGKILDKVASLQVKEKICPIVEHQEIAKQEREMIEPYMKAQLIEYSFWYTVFVTLHTELASLKKDIDEGSPTTAQSMKLEDLQSMLKRLRTLVNLLANSPLKEVHEGKRKNILFTQPVTFEELFKYKHILYYLSLLFDTVYIIPSGFDLSELPLPTLKLVKPEVLYETPAKLFEGTESTTKWFFCENPLNESLIEGLAMSPKLLNSLRAKSALLVNHLGLGDILNFNGAVHYTAENFDEVYLIIYTSNYVSTRTLYTTNHKIKILDVPKEETFWNLATRQWAEPFKSILPYFEKEFRTGIYLDITKSCANFPACFYEDLQIPLSIRRTHFRVPILKESKELFALLEGRPYIFTQQKCSELALNLVQWDKHKILTIDPNLNCYSKGDPFYELAERVRNKPFFHYTDIIQNADEIYVIDSAFGMYAYHMTNLKATVRRMFEREKGRELVNYFTT